MKNKPIDIQTRIIPALKKMEASLRTEIRRGDNSLRAEIKRGDKSLRQEILKVEERVKYLEEGQKRILSQMTEQHYEIMTAVSNFAGRVQNLEDENVVGANQFRDHEKRIAKLESAAQPPQ